MKLSIIVEAINRRDFMKRIFSTAMAIPSMTQEAAKDLVNQAIEGHIYQVQIEYWTYDDIHVSLEDNWNEFKNKYETISRLTGAKVYCVTEGEGLVLVSDVPISKALDIAQRLKFLFDSKGENGYHLFGRVNGYDGSSEYDASIVDDDPNNHWATRLRVSDDELTTHANLLKMWWERFEYYSQSSYMSENMAKLLKKHGLNPVRDIFNQSGSEGYNSKDAREEHTGSSEPEDWEEIPKYKKNDKDDSYDDYLMRQMSYESGIGESKKY